MTEAIGYMAALLLGACGVPEILAYFDTGQIGASWGMLIVWYIGEWMALAYTLIKSKKVKLIPLLVNYGLNIICISFMMVVK